MSYKRISPLPISEGGTGSTIQSAVSVRLADGGVGGLTGDGTIVVVPFSVENFDNNNDFNTGTYTFTAPKTGFYQVTMSLTFTGATAANTEGKTYISISTGVIYRTDFNPFAIAGIGTGASIEQTVLIFLTVGDTVNGQAEVTGEATKTVGIYTNNGNDQVSYMMINSL